MAKQISKELSREEKIKREMNKYYQALDLIEKGETDKLTEEHKEIIKKIRQLDNNNIKKNFREVLRYEIGTRGELYTFDADPKNEFDMQIIFVLEDGTEVDIETFIEKDLWKTNNKNLKLFIKSKLQAELWVEPDFYDKEKTEIVSTTSHYINELTSIRKLEQRLPHQFGG